MITTTLADITTFAKNEADRAVLNMFGSTNITKNRIRRALWAETYGNVIEKYLEDEEEFLQDEA